MLPTLSPPRAIDRLAGPISAFESETYDVIVQTTPRAQHLVLYVVVGMIVLTLILMSVVKVDRVVESSGPRSARGRLLVCPAARPSNR